MLGLFDFKTLNECYNVKMVDVGSKWCVFFDYSKVTDFRKNEEMRKKYMKEVSEALEFLGFTFTEIDDGGYSVYTNIYGHAVIVEILELKE